MNRNPLIQLGVWIGNHPSLTAWLLVVAFYLCAWTWFQPFRKSNFIRQDVISYYQVLPAVVIHGDVGMRYSSGNPYYEDKVWGHIEKRGMGVVSKYTVGMAVFYAPGFFLGHLHAKLGGWTADGYTQPYRLWLQIVIMAYFFIGLGLLRKILLRYAGEWSVACVLIALGLGTNLFYYVIVDPGMPHASLFLAVTMLMRFSIRFYESPDWRNSTLLALTGSLICLVRPNHVILWSIPMLYGVVSWSAVKERLRFWIQNRAKLISWGLIGAIVLAPQLLYWKQTTGSWLYYSYGEEGFFWTQPYLWQVLFSFRKGLFIYTPVMLFAIPGFFLLRKHTKDWGLAVWIPLLVSWYILSSWWCWWYGGSFGMRSFIDLFPLMAIGMALFFSRMGVDKKRISRWGMSIVITLFCLLNIFQAYQFHLGLLHHDSMTARAYLGILGKTKEPADLHKWLEAPDYEQAIKQR